MRTLVEAGADAKMANDYGVPPLAEAARTGNLEMCDILLKAGADPNAAPAGFPLLYGPVNEDHLDVRLLLASGANAHAPGYVFPLSAWDSAGISPAAARVRE